MGEKVGFTNCVFEKLCFAENTIFIVFQENTAFQKQNKHVEQNRKLMKNCGLSLNMAKWCCWVFFEVLMLLWCLFGVSCIVPSVKKAWFFSPIFGAFVGWVIFVYLGLEGLGVLVFLCLFFFCVGFVSVLFALFLFRCWIVFGVGSCFVFVLLFWFFAFVCCLFFCFLGRV